MVENFPIQINVIRMRDCFWTDCKLDLLEMLPDSYQREDEIWLIILRLPGKSNLTRMLDDVYFVYERSRAFINLF